MRNSFKTKVLHIYMGYNITVGYFPVLENIGPKSFYWENQRFPLNIRDVPFTQVVCVEVTAVFEI